MQRWEKLAQGANDVFAGQPMEDVGGALALLTAMLLAGVMQDEEDQSQKRLVLADGAARPSWCWICCPRSSRRSRSRAAGTRWQKREALMDWNGQIEVGKDGKAPDVVPSRQQRVAAGLLAVQEVEQERDACQEKLD